MDASLPFTHAVLAPAPLEFVFHIKGPSVEFGYGEAGTSGSALQSQFPPAAVPFPCRFRYNVSAEERPGENDSNATPNINVEYFILFSFYLFSSLDN